MDLYIIFGVVCFVLAIVIGFSLADGSGFPWILTLTTILVFLPMSSIVTNRYLRARRERGAQLSIGPLGLALPSLLRKPVPWSALQRMTKAEAFYKKERQNVFLILHSLEGSSHDFGHLGSLWTRKFNQWYYGSDLVIALEELEGEPEDVLQALKKLAPAELIARSEL